MGVRPARLPIDPEKERIVERLLASGALVLVASPGSGKTTRIPPAVLSRVDGEVLVLEPRRMAAKWAAARVASELGGQLGDLVGYQFRFENRTGPRTRLRYLTEGMLIRRLLVDRELRGVSAVVLDEFHERHVHGDLALAFVEMLRRSIRPDLKLLVLSATLDFKRLKKHLECPSESIDLPPHPLRVEYRPAKGTKPLECRVREAVLEVLDAHPGDVLVFLPGMAEIRRAEAELAPAAGARGILLLPLHGDLPGEAQDRAMSPDPRSRRVILSTNIAESSLTIPGIRVVVDSGLRRLASFSHWSGLPRIATRPVSRASAEQRAGRAAREAPGACIRLYSQAEMLGWPPYDSPEIHRADLAQTVLELSALGISEVEELPWLDPPEGARLDSARTLLRALGALDSEGKLTERGGRMARIPSHPRLGRLLLEAETLGCLSDAALLAALLQEAEWPADSRPLEDAVSVLRRSMPSPKAKRAVNQLLTAMRTDTAGVDASSSAASKEDRASLARTALAAFPDRIARVGVSDGSGRVELRIASGATATVATADRLCVQPGEWLLPIEAREKERAAGRRESSQLILGAAFRLDEGMLLAMEPSPLEERTEIEVEDGRAYRISRLRLGSIEISASRERPILTDPTIARENARALSKAVFRVDLDGLETLGIAELEPALARLIGPEEAASTLGRAEILASELPESAAGGLAGIVARRLTQVSSIDELRDLGWGDAILSEWLAERGRAELLSRVPAQVALPGRKQARIRYAPGKKPWIESRIQDYFGAADGPRLLGGRLSVVLHLLAPNGRAVQVTQDLAGFWKRDYPAIRRELARRYPKHRWPEDPLG